MPSTIGFLVLFCFLTALAQGTHAAFTGHAANVEASSTLSTQDLRVWAEQFPVPGSQLQEIMLDKQFLSDEEIHPFSGQSVVGLGITGVVQLHNERSVVRIVVVDDQLHEYLAYETYPLIAVMCKNWIFPFSQMMS